MDQSILDWLLEEETPEVRLRTLKEYMKLYRNGLFTLPSEENISATFRVAAALASKPAGVACLDQALDHAVSSKKGNDRQRTEENISDNRRSLLTDKRRTKALDILQAAAGRGKRKQLWLS